MSSSLRFQGSRDTNTLAFDSCKSKSVATKSFKIASAPPILTLHLKRFSVNYNSYNGKARADKFNHHIEFAEGLDLSPYMIQPNPPPNCQGGSESKKVAGARYRLFGVTCHRGVELRYGHYTSYVRSPGGAWYEADDEDMTVVPITKVLGDRTAYLLSYIRIGNGENGLTDKTPSSVNGSRTVKTPVLANGSRTGLLDGSSRPTPDTNGHGTSPITNGYNSSSKRKLEDEFSDKADLQAKRVPLSSIVHASSGFGSPTSSQSSSERTPSKFGYTPKRQRDNPIQARQLPEYQYNDSPNSKRRRNNQGRDGGGAKRFRTGAPMPFQQGNYGRGGKKGAGGGGFGTRAPGVYGRMKGRP